jgi:hypothetical protein
VADVTAHVGSQPVVKISKKAAEYVPEAQHLSHCGICEYFEKIEPDHCSKVRGIIAEAGWCKLFEKK